MTMLDDNGIEPGLHKDRHAGRWPFGRMISDWLQASFYGSRQQELTRAQHGQRHFEAASYGSAAFELVASDAMSSRDFFIIGRDGEGFVQHLNWLFEEAHNVTILSNPEVGNDLFAPGHWRQRFLMVDIDDFATTDEAVSFLETFRKHEPSTPVLVGSKTFARHDFSCERAMIADASVKLPAGRVSFALAIASAINNNDIINARLC